MTTDQQNMQSLVEQLKNAEAALAVKDAALREAKTALRDAKCECIRADPDFDDPCERCHAIRRIAAALTPPTEQQGDTAFECAPGTPGPCIHCGRGIGEHWQDIANEPTAFRCRKPAAPATEAGKAYPSADFGKLNQPDTTRERMERLRDEIREIKVPDYVYSFNPCGAFNAGAEAAADLIRQADLNPQDTTHE